MDNSNRDLIIEQSVEDLIPMQHTSLLKWTLATLTIFIAGVIILACVFPYPKTLKGNAIISCEKDSYKVFLYLSPEGTGEIRAGMPVHIYTSNYNEYTYGYLLGKVDSFVDDGKPNDNGLYCIRITLCDGLTTNYGYRLSDKLFLQGTGEVVVKEQRLIHLIIEPIASIFNK